MLESSIPVLHVSNAAAALAFYRDRLGFRLEFAHGADESLPDPCYMGFTRDHARLHVSSFPGDGVTGAAVLLVVDDVDALHEELLRRQVPIAMPPTDQTWGHREMYVRDPDGNALRFVRPLAG